MKEWIDIQRHRCSTGKVLLSKKEATESLHKLQRGTHRRKTYRETSHVYLCPLCGFYHISSKEHYEDREIKPLIHGNQFEQLIQKTDIE